MYSWLLERKKPRKTQKNAFSGVKMKFWVEKPVNACVEMSCCVSPSAGICFTGNGFRSTWLRVLTGISSCFQLFEPYMTGTAGGRSILHQSEGVAKWSVLVCRFPFFVKTSARGEFWWSASKTCDKANGPNRKSLTALDVEKLRGEDTHLGPEMSLRWVMVRENFEIAPFFGESLVQASDTFLQCNDTL